MAVREILVDWVTPSGGGKVSVFMFGSEVAVADQRAALNTFITNICDNVASTVSWNIRQDGRELGEATGVLSGVWNDPIGYNGVGDVALEPIPDASQVLIRWTTDDIVNGRFVRGRTYMPGMAVSNLDDGNVKPAVVAANSSIAQTLVDAGVALCVWHRPTNGAGGSLHTASGGSCWSELAVLRRRRG